MAVALLRDLACFENHSLSLFTVFQVMYWLHPKEPRYQTKALVWTNVGLRSLWARTGYLFNDVDYDIGNIYIYRSHWANTYWSMMLQRVMCSWRSLVKKIWVLWSRRNNISRFLLSVVSKSLNSSGSENTLTSEKTPHLLKYESSHHFAVGLPDYSTIINYKWKWHRIEWVESNLVCNIYVIRFHKKTNKQTNKEIKAQ